MVNFALQVNGECWSREQRAKILDIRHVSGCEFRVSRFEPATSNSQTLRLPNSQTLKFSDSQTHTPYLATLKTLPLSNSSTRFSTLNYNSYFCRFKQRS